MKKTYLLLIAIFTLNIANAQWQQTGLGSNNIHTIAISGSSIYAGTSNGVYLSSNGGNSWSAAGLNNSIINTLSINGSNILASTNAGVFSSSNNGTSWTKLFNGNITAIASDSSNIFIAEYDSLFLSIDIFLSTDNGNNWNKLNIIDSNHYYQYWFGIINSIVINNSNFLIISTDGGIYSIIKTGLNWEISIVSVNNSFGVNLNFTTLDKNGNKLYAGAIGDGGVFQSFDNGIDWTEITYDLGNSFVHSVIPEGLNIFAGTNVGVFYTLNNGIHWNNMSSGLTSPINTLLIYNNYLFAGTKNNGVWKRPLSDIILPDSAGTISGPTVVTQGLNSVTYTVPPIAFATSYVWTLPNGTTDTTTTDTLTINFANNATSGNLTVKGINSAGSGAASSLAITVTLPLPANAGAIIGADTITQFGALPYIVPPIAYATSYVWTLPDGTKDTTTTDTINIGFFYGDSGNLTVQGINSTGSGVPSSLAITVNIPGPPGNAGAILGPTTVIQGQNNVTYKVPPIAYATSYVWILPDGTHLSTTTDSITLNFALNASSGNLKVWGRNQLGQGSGSSFIAITVIPLPADAGNIIGPTAVNQGQSNVIYTVPPIAYATYYVWTLPNGTTDTTTTDTIIVNYANNAAPGNISVYGTNVYGNGIPSNLSITVNQLQTIGSVIKIGTNGDISYWNGSAWIIVPPGLPEQSLRFVNGIPSWINN